MAAPMPTTGLVFGDLASFPEDRLRRELIAGELVVTPAPRPRHQDVALNVAVALRRYSAAQGGRVLVAPVDVVFAEDTVLQPDVLFVSAEHADRVKEEFVVGAPDLVVEVSSPPTRRLELVRKRDVYERFGVPEYWYVDLDAERVEVYRLGEAGYAAPQIAYADEVLAPPGLPGLAVSVRDVLAAAA